MGNSKLIHTYGKFFRRRVDLPYKTCLGHYTLDIDRNGELSYYKEMWCPVCTTRFWVPEHGISKKCEGG